MTDAPDAPMPATMRCTICGSPAVVAVAPGSDAGHALDLFVIARPVPMRAWCMAHWPARARDPCVPAEGASA